MPSLKSGISSALPSFRLHLTMPCSSTAKLPAVCHLFPLSVDRTLIPSSLSNLDTLGMLPSTCQKLDVPKPHDPYTSRSASTMTLRFGWLFREGSGSAASHLSVAAWSLWETATNCTLGCAGAIARNCRKVFSATVAESAAILPGDL
jgi:hypothetical protein